MYMNLNQFANAINSVGNKVTILGRGEPGIGKSSVLKTLANLRPDFDTAYIDCTLLDLGDIALPYVETTKGGEKITRFAPNARFQLHTGRPAFVMLDELTKATVSVKNALLTLLQERRIGDSYLHKDSIVFATGNLDGDGVGDSLQAHARNRLCIIDITKPSAAHWAAWAMGNNINPLVVAFVMQYPQVLASYIDDAGNDNPYIYNPKLHQAGAFVTPRSLEQASHILDQRTSLGHEATIAMLAGVIGVTAALDMSAFIDIADSLPSWFAITSTPHSAVIPDSPMARAILVYSAVFKITASNLPAWMIYCQRLDLEFQAIFASQVLRAPCNKQTATNSREFIAWCAANSWAVC